MQPVLVTILIAAAAILLGGYVLAIVWRIAHTLRLRARAKGHLVLTFDDGPGPRMTSQLRDLLRREGVKATFFMTGFRADKHPEVARQTTLEGHELASHSQRHLNAWHNPVRSVADTWQGLAGVRAISPQAGFFRPPYGKATVWTHLACALKRFRVAYWTIDCKDAERHTIRQADDVTRELLAKGGGVVLMHDLDMDPQEFPEREQRVLELCESLIRCAKAQGMKIIPLGHLYPNSQLPR
jgi:peptidoglycan/xylan/chitin deacetylase (PgdA/CDA1 family)